jgi:hypothetical protein
MRWVLAYCGTKMYTTGLLRHAAVCVCVCVCIQLNRGVNNKLSLLYRLLPQISHLCPTTRTLTTGRVIVTAVFMRYLTLCTRSGCLFCDSIIGVHVQVWVGHTAPFLLRPPTAGVYPLVQSVCLTTQLCTHVVGNDSLAYLPARARAVGHFYLISTKQYPRSPCLRTDLKYSGMCVFCDCSPSCPHIPVINTHGPHLAALLTLHTHSIEALHK